ncbi:hypothetical protein U717_10605 [Rhodobacter capsulatus R121]|nr:hypothetical protein U714_10450 [Rhodobacter capsulatus DE442]ETD76904.1 hypothetical protein U717_10605 [Rhodobacter capsulatus R121]ETE53740.1 hypothetical protein U715_10605 [Rhodobacter capsulatus Y262]
MLQCIWPMASTPRKRRVWNNSKSRMRSCARIWTPLPFAPLAPVFIRAGFLTARCRVKGVLMLKMLATLYVLAFLLMFLGLGLPSLAK